MKKLSLLTVFLALGLGQAYAADPIGDWRVEDGTAHIRIAICGGKLWGVIGWEKQPGTDAENPDPTKKSRPTLGLPILIDMKPGENGKWLGQIYNAQNGKMYQANVQALSDTSLKVQGCVMGGLFCGGETWTRVIDPAAAVVAPAPTAKPSTKKGTTTGIAPQPSSPSASVCAGLGLVSRASH